MKINIIFKNINILSILFLLSTISVVNVRGQVLTQTYSLGDIPTSNGSYSSSCNGPTTPFDFTLPAGGPYQITSIDVSYDMVASGSAWMSDQMSKIYCQNTSTGEASFIAGTNSGNGTETYNRTGLNIANGTYSGGTVLTFEMQAYRTWCGTCGCNTTENMVANNTWTITINYFNVNPMTYVSSSVSQNYSTGVALGQTNQSILKLEVITNGSTSPFDLTDIQMNMNGTTSISDVTDINIYYTGTSNSFATTTLFGNTTPASGTINVNGNQQLALGSNYFWIAYDIASAATVSNFIDAEITQITMNGSGGNQNPSGNPASGNREIIATPVILPLFYNSGFENSSSCPSSNSQIDLVDGLSSCWTTYDYYNTCGYADKSCDAVTPSSGNGFVGSFGGAWSTTNVQTEWFTITLDNPTVIGGNYDINIDINLESGSNSCSSNGYVGSCMDYGIYFYKSSSPPTCGGAGFHDISTSPVPQVIISGNSLSVGSWTTHTINYVPNDVYDRALVGFFPNANSSSGGCTTAKTSSYAYMDNLCMDKPGNNCAIALDSSCNADFNLDKVGQLCVGEQIIISDNSFAELGIDNISWTIDSVNFGSSSQVSYSFNQSGIYSIELIVEESTANCFDTLTQFVYVNEIQSSSLVDSILLCKVGEINLSSNDSLSFNYCELILVMNDISGDGWSGGFISIDDGRILSEYKALNYGFTSTNTSDTVKFIVSNEDSIKVYYTQGSNNSEVSFSLISPSGNMLYTTNTPAAGFHYLALNSCDASSLAYDWIFTDSTYNSDSISVFVDQTQQVILNVSYEYLSCINQDSIMIVLSVPTINIGNDTIICEGENFDIILPSTNLTYVWQDGTNSQSYTINETGLYWVEASLDSCKTVDSINVLINPTPFVDAGTDSTVFSGDTFVLLGVIDNSVINYYWNDDNSILDNDNFLNPEIVLESTTSFYLYGSTENGCYSNDTVIITIIDKEIPEPEECNIIIPTAFTPDNDGVNDEWNIINIECLENYSIKVFNRWGALVYQSESEVIYTPWDGGNLPIASYYYIIEYEDSIEGNVKVNGVLSLIK